MRGRRRLKGRCGGLRGLKGLVEGPDRLEIRVDGWLRRPLGCSPQRAAWSGLNPVTPHRADERFRLFHPHDHDSLGPQ